MFWYRPSISFTATVFENEGSINLKEERKKNERKWEKIEQLNLEQRKCSCFFDRSVWKDELLDLLQNLCPDNVEAYFDSQKRRSIDQTSEVTNFTWKYWHWMMLVNTFGQVLQTFKNIFLFSNILSYPSLRYWWSWFISWDKWITIKSMHPGIYCKRYLSNNHGLLELKYSFFFKFSASPPPIRGRDERCLLKTENSISKYIPKIIWRYMLYFFLPFFCQQWKNGYLHLYLHFTNLSHTICRLVVVLREAILPPHPSMMWYLRNLRLYR